MGIIKKVIEKNMQPIEFYIADFYCHKLKLVIEVDGEIHTENEIQSHDEGRNGELERFGIEVLRFTNDQILHDCDLVVLSLRERGNEGERPVNQK